MPARSYSPRSSIENLNHNLAKRQIYGLSNILRRGMRIRPGGSDPGTRCPGPTKDRRAPRPEEPSIQTSWKRITGHTLRPAISPLMPVSAVGDMEAEGASIPLGDLLHELQIEDKEIVSAPASFQVPPGQVAAVECEQMIVYEASVAFTAIPKHASFYLQTAEIPVTMLEATLAIRPSTTQA